MLDPFEKDLQSTEKLEQVLRTQNQSPPPRMYRPVTGIIVVTLLVIALFVIMSILIP